MHLIFIHGWALDWSFWDALLPLLPECRATVVERGFFTTAPASAIPEDEPAVLVGHSLGFLHGMNARRNWRGLVAINAFARFTPDCVSAPALQEMKNRMQRDVGKTLRVFHDTIGAQPPYGNPNLARLDEGLDELRDHDLTETLIALNLPHLSLASRNDPLVPESASRALSAATQFHPTGGHVLPRTEPVWCAEAIRTFLKTIS